MYHFRKAIVAITLFVAGVTSPQAATSETATVTTQPQTQAGAAGGDTYTTRTLGDFLTTAGLQKPKGPGITGFYADIPANLEKAVRHIAEDNYTSANAMLLSELQKSADKKERARIQMWLGLSYGQQAIDYPSLGWQAGTSSSVHLKEAVAADQDVFLAPDVARIMAEMVAGGWANEDPTTALERAEKEAEKSRRAVDYYYAAIISKRLSARAWSYSDTTEQDKKTLALLAKSVALDPARYETWSSYLRSLMPVGLHDMATTEALKMYDFFKELRTPVLGDQGPALLFQQTSSYRTMQQDEQMWDDLGKKWPDAPLPPFEMAMRAIETTAPLALQWFPKIVDRIDSGTIRLLPREQGYLVSALYKIAFLLQQDQKIAESAAMYERVKKVSPHYAEVDMNLGIVNAQLSDAETTGPKKLEYLEKAIKHAEEQEKHDYRGRAALKAFELRQKLRTAARQVKKEIETSGTMTAKATTTTQGSVATTGTMSQ